MKPLFVGSLLSAVVASGILSPSNVYAAARPDFVSPERATALRECNIKANAFTLYTWGDVQLYLYRECMFSRDQPE
jgi:hypothetical protein